MLVIQRSTWLKPFFKQPHVFLNCYKMERVNSPTSLEPICYGAPHLQGIVSSIARLSVVTSQLWGCQYLSEISFGRPQEAAAMYAHVPTETKFYEFRLLKIRRRRRRRNSFVMKISHVNIYWWYKIVPFLFSVQISVMSIVSGFTSSTGHRVREWCWSVSQSTPEWKHPVNCESWPR